MLLLELGFSVPDAAGKIAFLIDKNVPDAKLAGIFREAMELRAEGKCVDIARMKKNKKFQKDQLVKEGYRLEDIKDFYNTEFKN